MEHLNRSHIYCPECHCREAYQLADGRRKCRRCGKKFTHRRQVSRLDNKTLKQIAVFFWLMVPASKVAEDLRLNRKTVQRHYRLLRQAIGLAAEDYGDETGVEANFEMNTDGKRGAEERPVVGLAIQGRTIRVTLAPNSLAGQDGKTAAELQALIFSGTDHAFRSRDLQDMHIQLKNQEPAQSRDAEYQAEMLKFWRFVRGMIKMYRGRHREDFALFMREVEFRFNQRHSPDVIPLLVRYLKQSGG